MLTISKLKAVVDQLLHLHRQGGRIRRHGSGARPALSQRSPTLRCFWLGGFSDLV